MEVHQGFDIGGNTGSHIIKFNKSLHGLCQSSHNWWNLFKSSLETREYKNQSIIDQCVFIGKESIALIYVDDCIIFSKKGSFISDRLIKSLANGKDYFKFTDEGYLLNIYLGLNINMHKDRSIEVTQPHLIEGCIELADQEKPSTLRQLQ